MLIRSADPHRRRRGAGAAVIAVVLALVTAIGGCGTGSDLQSASTSTRQADPGPTGGKAASVVMKNLDFSPTAVTARVGQKVTWLNEDEAPHNVTYVSGPRFRSSRRRLRIGDRFSITLRTAGTIRYVCTLHPWMQATITVSR